MKSIAAASVLTFIKITVLPDINLMAWVFIVVVLDFLTGVLKAVYQKKARTSAGFRKTVVKFAQYGIAIIAGMVLANTVKGDEDGNMNAVISFLNSGLLVFIIYIEVTSVFENIYALDKKSKMSVYIIKPVLALLTLQLDKLSKLKNIALDGEQEQADKLNNDAKTD